MSAPAFTPVVSSQSMMLAMLLDRINALEQNININKQTAHQMIAAPIAAPVSALQGPVSALQGPVSALQGPVSALPSPNGVMVEMAELASNAASKEASTDEIQIEIEETSPEDDPSCSLVGIGNSEHVAILARVSTSEQKASHRESLSNQVESCTEQMRKMGCKNAYLIRQIDESASKDGQQQEEFFDTVTKFRKHPVVFVRTVTRFSRQLKLGLQRMNMIHQAGGRIIFGVPEDDGLAWYDSSTERGRTKFEAQLSVAEAWAKEMSITARDNAKRKREREQEARAVAETPAKRGKKQPAIVALPSIEDQRQQRLQKQISAITEAYMKNNRDSLQLRMIIEWIRTARRGGSSSVVLNRLKDLVNWNLWKSHPRYNEWRINPWVFTDITKNIHHAEAGELTFEWIATNLREWRVRVPPIKGIATIKSAWTTELVECLHELDSTEEVTRMFSRM